MTANDPVMPLPKPEKALYDLRSLARESLSIWRAELRGARRAQSAANAAAQRAQRQVEWAETVLDNAGIVDAAVSLAGLPTAETTP